MAEPYHADASLAGKLRRRLVRLQSRRPCPVQPARPMVSFAFDDALESAFHAGAQVLEDRGVRGTYFVCAGLAGSRDDLGPYGARADMQRVAAAGHEIACHTHSHLDCGQADGPAVQADVERNLKVLQSWGLPTPTTFAYPFGDVSAPAKRVVGARFILSRALHHGLVEKGSDLNQAPAVGVEGPDGEAAAMSWLARAKARSAWLILFTHGVEAGPNRFGASATALARLVDKALADGLEVVTVAEGARRLAEAA